MGWGLQGGLELLQLGRDWPPHGKERLEGWEEKGLGFQGGLEKGEPEEKLWEEASTTSLLGRSAIPAGLGLSGF